MFYITQQGLAINSEHVTHLALEFGDVWSTREHELNCEWVIYAHMVTGEKLILDQYLNEQEAKNAMGDLAARWTARAITRVIQE